MISVLLGASRVTGRISGRSSLEQCRRRAHANIGVKVGRGLGYYYSQRKCCIWICLHLGAWLGVHSVGIMNIPRPSDFRSTLSASENLIVVSIHPSVRAVGLVLAVNNKVRTVTIHSHPKREGRTVDGRNSHKHLNFRRTSYKAIWT